MKTGFIGCGNMGGALVKARAKTAGEILISDRHPEKINALCETTGARSATPEQVCAECGYIFLGVKPQAMTAMLDSVKPVLAARKDRFILVTMAAGLTMSAIQAMAGGEYPIIRIMPNLAAAIGESMTLWCSCGTTAEENAAFLESMRFSGRFMELSENLIDAGSAVSGCGPAYVFMFIEALADGAVSIGIKRAAALELAAQTLLGASKLMMETGRHPDELKDAVCSPGGTTIAGVLRLEEGAFRSDCAQAVVAAYEKTLKLKK